MYRLKLIITFIFVLILLSCDIENEAENYYEIESTSHRQFEFLNDDSVQITLIRIDDSTHFKIGGFISDYFLLDSSIVLIKRFPASITNIDMKGGILWTLTPMISDFRIFESIGHVYFESSSDSFEVFDYSSMNTYTYSLKGEFISRRKTVFKFNDKIRISNNCLIYDSGDLKEFSELNNGKNRILEKCNDSTIIYKNSNLGNNGSILFNDYFAFIRNQTELFYLPDFSDTLYSFHFEKKDLIPDKVIKILPADERYEVLNNDNVLSKYQSLVDNQIPFLYKVGVIKNYLFGVYLSDGGYKNFIIDIKSNQVLCNSKHIILNGITLRSPFLFGENSLLVQMPDYQFDLLNSLKKNEMTEDLEIEKLLSEAKSDIGGMAYILIQ